MKPAHKKNTRVKDRMKLHLRLYKIGPRTLRVLTPRPGTPVAFSNNYFHDTWHILTGRRGSRFLARMLWALSYQKKPGTVFLIDRPFLVSNPFEAERPAPIILCNSDLGRPHRKELEQLKQVIARSRKRPPDGTVRLFSQGLDLIRENGDDFWEMGPRYNDIIWRSETCERVAGFIRYAAPGAILRRAACSIDALDFRYGGMDYTDIGFYTGRQPAGEVQIFRDFHRRVTLARQAREYVLARGKRPGPPSHEDEFREAVWKRAEHMARKESRVFQSKKRKQAQKRKHAVQA